MKIILALALVFIIVSIVQRVKIRKKINRGVLEIDEIKKLTKHRVQWTWLLILGLFPFVIIALLMMALAYGFSQDNVKSKEDIAVTNYKIAITDKDSINVSVEIHDEQTKEGLVRFSTINKDTIDQEFVINSLNICYLANKDTLFLYYYSNTIENIPKEINNIVINANKLNKTQFDSMNIDTNLRIITKIPQ